MAKVTPPAKGSPTETPAPRLPAPAHPRGPHRSQPWGNVKDGASPRPDGQLSQHRETSGVVPVTTPSAALQLGSPSQRHTDG